MDCNMGGMRDIFKKGAGPSGRASAIFHNWKSSLRSCMAGLALIWLSLAAAQAADPPEPKGSLVIIGGGLRGDNADIWQRIVQLAGGKGARIAVFPSAAGAPER